MTELVFWQSFRHEAKVVERFNNNNNTETADHRLRQKLLVSNQEEREKEVGHTLHSPCLSSSFDAMLTGSGEEREGRTLA